MNRAQLRVRTAASLGDLNFKRWTQDEVNTSLEKGYKLLTSRTGSIQKSTPFPFATDSPYYNFRQFIPDYFATIGIYNFKTNLWIDFVTEKTLNSLRWDWERWVGEPTNCGLILDWNRVGIFPYQTEPSGTFLLWYKARPGVFNDSTRVILPETFQQMLVEYATADLLGTDREFIKSNIHWKRFLEQGPALDREINNLAYYDKNLVIEPYWPLGHYGPGGFGNNMIFVDNVIPAGVIDGVNPTFTLPQIPNPPSSLLLMRNGQVAFEGDAYTLVGNQITYNIPHIPKPPIAPDNVADVHRAWFRVI